MIPSSAPIGAVRTMACARAGDVEDLVGQQIGALGGVVLEDRRRQLDFTLGLGDGLAHLQGHQPGEIGGVLSEQVGDPSDDGGALLEVDVAPVEVGLVRPGERTVGRRRRTSCRSRWTTSPVAGLTVAYLPIGAQASARTSALDRNPGYPDADSAEVIDRYSFIPPR